MEDNGTIWQRALDSFSRGSSPIDWCEDNYRHHPAIAETANTFSNVFFILVPPFGNALCHQIKVRVDQRITLMWLLFALVGVCSGYFHATLSLAGQLVDELSILWLFLVCCLVLAPNYVRVGVLVRDDLFQLFIISLGVLISALSVLAPRLNAFLLLSTGIVPLWVISQEFMHCTDPVLRRLVIRTIAVWFLAVLAWVADRTLCSLWLSLGVPYLHALWHVLIFFGSYPVIPIFTFMKVRCDLPNLHPTLRWWPPNRVFQLPYVHVEDVTKEPIIPQTRAQLRRTVGTKVAE